MKGIITLAFAAILSLGVHAQVDTLQKDPSIKVEVYDVVAVYKEHRDGRGNIREYTSELKGKILSYDASTGLLTFKGLDGKMYSFKSGDYKYFEYDKQFTSKVKNTQVYPRKEREFEFSAGFRTSWIAMRDDFTGDDYYVNSNGGYWELPLSIYLGAGKYFSRRHFAGVSGELTVLSDGNFFSGGLRYAYQYDAHKRNVAFYLPVELQYFQVKTDARFQVNDTVYDVQSGGTVYYYPSDLNLDYTLSSLSFSLGQGFSFIMKNKHSIALELSLVRFFPFEPKYINLDREPPKTNFTGNGFRFSLIYNI
jgi:hypothetical protein